MKRLALITASFGLFAGALVAVSGSPEEPAMVRAPAGESEAAERGDGWLAVADRQERRDRAAADEERIAGGGPAVSVGLPAERAAAGGPDREDAPVEPAVQAKVDDLAAKIVATRDGAKRLALIRELQAISVELPPDVVAKALAVEPSTEDLPAEGEPRAPVSDR